MSWHYLQGEEEASWAESSLDGAPCALLSLMPTAGGCSLPGNGTGCCHDFPSGTMCERSTAGRGEDGSISSREDFPAKISPAPELGRESKEVAPDSGSRWRELLVRYDLGSSSWKTHQCLWEEALPWSSVTLLRWGMMRSGVLWELVTPVLPISGTESGFWHTIRASDGQRGGRGDLIQAVRGNKNTHFRLWTTPSASDAQRGGRITENMTGTSLAQQVKTPEFWPTPRATDGERGGSVINGWNRHLSSNRLRDMVKTFPPPTSSMFTEADMEQARFSGNDPRRPSYQEAKLLPTPTVQDAHNNAGPSQMALNVVAGGALNPTWVAWLMGWPLGWTSLEPLVMDRYRQWCGWHGIACEDSAIGVDTPHQQQP